MREPQNPLAWIPPSPPVNNNRSVRKRPLESLSVEFTELLASNNFLGDTSRLWEQSESERGTPEDDIEELGGVDQKFLAESSSAGESSMGLAQLEEAEEEGTPWQRPRPQGFAFPVKVVFPFLAAS